MRLNRPKTPAERHHGRPSNVVAHVKGWNDTHVIVDVYVGGQLVTENLNRPIERFMAQYGLNG